MRWSGEDISTNISLQAILAQQGIKLPDFEMPEDKAGIDQYFQSVVTAISTMPKWRVLTDIYLGFFSFTKFIMYKDLDPQTWPEGISPADHHLMQDIFNPSPDHQSDTGYTESEVEDKLSAPDVYHIMDADPSQIMVIEDAKAGRNLVVEGPPGTGKSQTITNIIAEFLAAKKSVLFISEKMAALEVVKRRLDQAGLGDFCLELHSRKSNKKAVLDELRRTIDSSPPKDISGQEELNQLVSVKSELNNYAKALREPLGNLGLSPFALFCMSQTARGHFIKVRRSMPRVTIPNTNNCRQAELNAAQSALRDLSEALALVKPVTKHPWRGCRPDIVLPSTEEEIGRLIDECREATARLVDSIDRIVEACAIKRPKALNEMPRFIESARTMAKSKPLDRQVLLNTVWNKPNQQAEALIQKVETLQAYLTVALSQFHDQAFSEDIAPILNDYRVLSTKFILIRLFDSKYRRLKDSIAKLYKGLPPRKSEKIISDVEGLQKCQSLKREIAEGEQTALALFGSYWKQEASNTQTLREIAKWVPSFRQLLSDGAVTGNAVDLVSHGISWEHIEKLIGEVTQVEELFTAKRNLMAERINIDYQQAFGASANDLPFSDLTSRLDMWKAELSRLQRWAQFISLTNNCTKTMAAPLVQHINEDTLYPDDLVPCFDANFADCLLRLGFEERPALANFIGVVHEKKIQNFMRFDRELINWNRRRLAQKLYQSRPHVSGGASVGSEAGILLGQFSRKRGHMPIRKLMSLCGGLIRIIKPCFMMSPLSIAQFLDPKIVRFDAIIFDEASQVRPEDALGALLRGNQAIVVGDSRQLPPTTFFDRIVQGSDEEEHDGVISVSEIESILDVCKRSFPSKTLRWHYRSRHESLIAVSNQEFYDNRLLIYPSHIDKSEDLGLMFIHLPGTVYDRGRSQVNRKEARAVAEAVLEHYRKSPDKSLGVGAFNINQQEAILQEVELQLRSYPEMEDFFSRNREEHFFVKNLETIQGDERDVIFISIGFGFDADRRLTLQLGPLNQEGGERRLNVLITRARERCVVFSNFRASDLVLDDSASVGLKSLKVFLDYAENRRLRSAASFASDTFSPFEQLVYEFLQGQGYDVRKQVGAAGFRIDLAIADSKSRTRYILGIETDGPKYHSCLVTRERDRLRQQVLEDRGWHIYRVWSTDWYRIKTEFEASLLKAVEQQLEHEESLPAESHADSSAGRTVPQPENICNGRSGIEQGDTTTPIVYSAADNMTPDYQVCLSLGVPQRGELNEQPTRLLAEVVSNIVKVEGPVHFDEVVRRVRSLWGLKRASGRIYDIMNSAASIAEQTGNIRWSGDFLWPVPERPTPVRRRSGDPPPRIDLICVEEIGEAIKLVLKRQFATPSDELALQSSRLLGIHTIHGTTQERVNRVIKQFIVEGVLQETTNGMIDLTRR